MLFIIHWRNVEYRIQKGKRALIFTYNVFFTNHLKHFEFSSDEVMDEVMK